MSQYHCFSQTHSSSRKQSKIQDLQEPLHKKMEIQETAYKQPPTFHLASQITPKPIRKVLLFGDEQKKYLFPLVRDRQIGIEEKYQNVVIESYNDDDRKTTTTQMQRGMTQTLNDLYDTIHSRNKHWEKSQH